jgi:hypothetical protein
VKYGTSALSFFFPCDPNALSWTARSRPCGRAQYGVQILSYQIALRNNGSPKNDEDREAE